MERIFTPHQLMAEYESRFSRVYSKWEQKMAGIKLRNSFFLREIEMRENKRRNVIFVAFCADQDCGSGNGS